MATATKKETEIVKDVHDAKAQTLWASLTENEKTAIRFGLFPASKIAEVEAEGFDGRMICLSLMDCAKKNGGMRA